MDDSVPTAVGCACPLGEFFDAAGASCKACISPCKTCAGSGSTCTSCVVGFYKYTYLSGTQTINECLSTCPADRTPNSSNDECVKCDTNDNCATCTSQTVCTQCKTGTFKYLDKCFTACPVGTYADVNACGKCDIRCKTCTSFTVCTTCDTLGYVLVGTTCQCKNAGEVFDTTQ